VGYRDNVAALCEKRGIENPIREEDLTVMQVCFSTGQGAICVGATDMNRAGRLFFQEYVENDGNRTVLVKGLTLDLLKRLAELFFAENWADAESAGRQMLVLFKKSTMLVVEWKESR
jgi:hypothetical protein